MTDLRQLHYRYRTDANAADATPTWGAGEDSNFNPGAANFRLRMALRNAAGTATGSVPWQLYASKNGGSYAAVTTSSTSGVKSIDAGSSADDTAILIPRLYPFSSDWQLSGAAIDLDFAGGRAYGGEFTDCLSCSRASIGYAKTTSGTLTQFGTDTLRITDLGLLVEDARTNVVLWNRDLTNAAWTPTNITAAKDQIGPDGVTNSASSIISTAGNGTILQSITLASAAAFQSAYVKRITGTGVINMTMDNGATWTAITVTSNWTLVSIPTQTLANPTVGFQIVTSGDKIAVDFVQNENGTFGSSPIPTTTTSATRAADVVTCTGSLNTVLQTTSDKSVVIDAIMEGSDTSMLAQNFAVLGDWITQFIFFYASLDNNIRATGGGATAATATSGGPLWTTGARFGIASGSTGYSLVMGGGTVVTDANPVNPTTASKINDKTGANTRGFFYTRRITVWNSKLADATLQGYTAP